MLLSMSFSALFIVAILAAPPAVTPATPPKDVVATVNGIAIKRTTLDASLQAARMNPLLFGSPLPKSPEETAKVVLDQLISAELLAQEAQKKGVAVTEAEVDASMKQTKAAFASEADYLATLKENGFTEADIRADARRQIAIKRLFEKDLLPNVPAIDEATARGFYDTNPFQFTEPEESRVAHILVIVDADADAKKLEKARQKIGQAVADLKEGKDFAGLARSVSEDDGSREKGGDVGWVVRGEWPAEFVTAANALQKKGELSPVVKTRFGLHVLKLLEKHPAKRLPYDEKLKKEIVAFLDRKRQEDMALDYVDALRKKAKVETFLPPSP